VLGRSRCLLGEGGLPLVTIDAFAARMAREVPSADPGDGSGRQESGSGLARWGLIGVDR